LPVRLEPRIRISSSDEAAAGERGLITARLP
jgi:hypothetical protein